MGKGRRFYESVLRDPELMPEDIDYSDVSHRIRRAINDLHYERYGDNIPPYGWDYPPPAS